MTRARKLVDTATQTLAMEHLIMKRGTKFVTCDRCDASFKLNPGDAQVVPPHRFRGVLCQDAASEATPEEWARPEAATSARYWHQLAIEADAWGAYEAKQVGSGAAYFAKARMYRETAWALMLEAVTGELHCSLCFRNHPNHHHAHRG